MKEHNAHVIKAFIQEQQDLPCINTAWVIWALDYIADADGHGVLVNPEYLRAQLVDLTDPEPPMRVKTE